LRLPWLDRKPFLAVKTLLIQIRFKCFWGGQKYGTNNGIYYAIRDEEISAIRKKAEKADSEKALGQFEG
jgi:hypothetical protein